MTSRTVGPFGTYSLENWLKWCKDIYGVNDPEELRGGDVHIGAVGTRCLNGKGKPLLAGCDPVWLRFKPGEIQKNSAGVPFDPQAPYPELK